MEHRIMTAKRLHEYETWLWAAEKSGATVEKYLRDVRAFQTYLRGAEVQKQTVIAYKQTLVERGYAVRSINSMLASLNSFFRFLGWEDCLVRSIRTQRQTYCPEAKELSKAEYLRLVQSAHKRPRLQLLLEAICSTGIRVSELAYFTVEAVQNGEIEIMCKGKTRTILLPGKLRRRLLEYARHTRISSGPVFCTRSGRPLNRSNIWAEMKGLCGAAGVAESKVFPHNLRKLFARTFYSIEKDIAKLADLLGHSNINTTRIYIISTGTEHRRKIDRLGLVI